MFGYEIEDPALASELGDRVFWSALPLQPLVSSLTTPFSYSVLAELVSRAWYLYYDRLGFKPEPGGQYTRCYEGRSYLDLTILAQLEMACAHLDPLLFEVNGQAWPVCKPEKSGLLSAIKGRRSRNRMLSIAADLQKEVESTISQAQEWFEKVDHLCWSQAEILQVMEEIERRGPQSMLLFLAAQNGLMRIFNQFYWMIQPAQRSSEWLAFANGLWLSSPQFSEYKIDVARAEIRQKIEEDPIVKNTLSQSFVSPSLNPDLDKLVTSFLDQFGHCVDKPAEIHKPRWRESTNELLRFCRQETSRSAHGSIESSVTAFLGQIPQSRQKEVHNLLHRLEQYIALQSHAQDALAYIFAGARNWVLAAGQEAVSDGRIEQVEDIFYFELEKVKEMMTGEWNISATQEIRTMVSERQAEFSSYQGRRPPVLLISDQEAQPL